MAKLITATPIGLRTFSNRDKSRWYYMVNVTFEDPECTGLNCANVFVSDTDYPVIQSQFGNPDFTIDIISNGRGYEYLSLK